MMAVLEAQHHAGHRGDDDDKVELRGHPTSCGSCVVAFSNRKTGFHC
jgi:hypothetical protein